MGDEKKPVSPVPIVSTELKALCDLHTSARLFRSHAGRSLLTRTQLELRFDHAAAADAVNDDAHLEQLLPNGLLQSLGIFEVQSRAESRAEFLANPNLGRRLSDDAISRIKTSCKAGHDIQIFVGDGLSAAAVRSQVPELLPLLIEAFNSAHLSVGQIFFVKNCRVGVLNDVGEILRPKVAILLIGERPGLSTAESLSAYLAYEPRCTHTDANRNLLSNIHRRGINLNEAVDRIVAFAQSLIHLKLSGVSVKESDGIRALKDAALKES